MNCIFSIGDDGEFTTVMLASECFEWSLWWEEIGNTFELEMVDEGHRFCLHGDGY